MLSGPGNFPGGVLFIALSNSIQEMVVGSSRVSGDEIKHSSGNLLQQWISGSVEEKSVHSKYEYEAKRVPVDVRA